MRLAGFEPFPPEQQKRIAVQKAVNQWNKESWSGAAPKVYCLSNYTLNGIDVFLSYHLLSKKLRPLIAFSDFNVVVQTVLDDSSSLYAFAPDFVVLSLDLRILIQDYQRNAWDAEQAAAQLRDLLALIRDKVRAPVLVTDFVLPLVDGTRRAGGLDDKVGLLNRTLAEFAAANARQFFLLDMNRLVGLLGAHEALDARLWHQSKAPFKSPMLSWLAREMATVIGAHYGLSKKCVILDCDNTLWGGVIGEDGMEGIALDASRYPGVAFHEFQSYLLNLHAQGILLAICSKNNEADVLQVFDSHPHSQLKREHFVCIRANWNSKADNIADIAATLQLGLNNFVFIDDSPVECALVEQALPELDLIQAPADPLELRRIWQAENLFFVPYRTEEDGQKLRQYKDNDSRRDSAAGFADIGQFLLSLETSVELWRDEPSQLERLAQLTQKTNQFNLRTVRYSLQDIEGFMASPAHLVFSMRVGDKFGDLGITNLCIIALDGEGVAFIDTFLMSCRVIKRELEFFFLHHCLQVLREQFGVLRVAAEYIPTSKNMLVERLWDEAGLTPLAGGADGVKRYQAQIDRLSYAKPAHIHIKGAH
jgi:FkbH-like protein